MTRYELLERIGVGGMAEIFRGKAVAGGGFEKPVAIKRILPHLSQDERFVKLLMTEAKTLSELRHRNIVQIYDVGLGGDGQYFLVMEFVDGLDLAEIFEDFLERRERLPLDVSLHIAAEVCQALEHAHAARDAEGNLVGLVHRDVSPSNILLSRSGEVKLTDFGIAKRTEELTGHGGVRGKFAYLSPEQANNIHVDARSDVCSLGMVLFELIAGKRLLSGLPDFDALAAVREHRLPALREIDPGAAPELEALIEKALAPDPADRFQSAEEFAASLRSYRYDELTSSGDPARAAADIVRRALALEDAGAEDEAEPGGREPLPEHTVVFIRSAAGFGPPAWDDADDRYSEGRPLFDGDDDDDDEMTVAQTTPIPELLAAPEATENFERAEPEGTENFERVDTSTATALVDPEADTVLAAAPDDDADFDGDPTRQFEPGHPLLVALATERERRRAPLPPPRPALGTEADAEATDPRAEAPAAPPGSLTPPPELTPAPAAAPRPMAPGLEPRHQPAPIYPRASDTALRRFHHRTRILGMRREVAYWVLGGSGALLVIILIALLAGGSGGAGGAAPGGGMDAGPSAIDGG